MIYDIAEKIPVSDWLAGVYYFLLYKIFDVRDLVENVITARNRTILLCNHSNDNK